MSNRQINQQSQNKDLSISFETAKNFKIFFIIKIKSLVKNADNTEDQMLSENRDKKISSQTNVLLDDRRIVILEV